MQEIKEEEVPTLTLVKSANILKLDLNYKMSKKSEIKLLNAKIRNLKNKCKALREESKTDRQILSNLMNTTSELQTKTNLSIQACMEVSTQLSDNHGQIIQFSVNQNLNQILDSASELAFESDCTDLKTKEAKKRIESLEKIFENLPLEKTSEYKNAICNIPTERSMTASLKSQGNEKDDISLDGYLLPANMKTGSEEFEPLQRANTVSFSPSKSTKLQRRHSLPSDKLLKANRKVNQSNSYNMFTTYIYTVLCTAVLTIIFFKLVF